MKFLFYTFTFLVIFIGCGSSSSSIDEPAQRIKSLSVDDIEASSTITLKLANSDKLESYIWRDENGAFLANTPTTEWKAPSQEGSYRLSVDTVDVNGEKLTTSITIKVIQSAHSDSRPVISLDGEKNIALSLGEEYEERGASATDEEDGDLTDNIIISGEVDIYAPDRYIITYSVTDSDEHTTVISRTVTVSQAQAEPFARIKKLIYDSGNKRLSDATYICIGDSTRARSRHDGHFIFEQVSHRLNDFGVKSYLHAKAGHTAKEFNENGSSPTWRDVVYDIPSDGKNCIVDISLGINDSWGENSNFKSHLKSAISKMKIYKPKTNFMLTMPNRVYGNRSMTNSIKEQYLELSKELHIPLVNIVEDIMPSQSATKKSWYREDGFNVHLSREGQRLVAEDILLHILPN